MNRTRAAIYTSASNEQAVKSQVLTLTRTLRNDGCVLTNNSYVYTDIGKTPHKLANLLKDAETHKFQVLYVDFSQIPIYLHPDIKQAIKTIYIYGLSAIVRT